MNAPRDPDASSADQTFAPGPPAGPEVTVAPSGDFPAPDPSIDRTDPSRGTRPSGGSAPTAFDETRAAPSLVVIAAVPDPTDADVTRTAVAAPGGGGGRPSPAGVAVDRYVLRGFHAKGGLGEVHRAQDLELDREVAFKRIQAKFADDAGWREQFVAEARVTARLDHPGVVPVFGLVADGHGRPCYAMRFVAGPTLRQELDRYHGTSRGGDPAAPTPADPDARRVVFRQLLQRVVAVCQAVGFAHTRGVIHRDLKPANVMVGEFGETLVVDWGLAKDLASRGRQPSGSERADAAGDATAGTATFPADADPEERTAAGRAVGTPAFMPPEQALGRPDVGPAADVFGLGAVLFYTLTGRAPYAGADATKTVHLAQRAEYPRPRAIAPATPAALEAVCLKAMALNPADRYPTALDLAADVERWLADEPVTAHRDPPAARAARWARRNPARVAGAVTALVGGLAAAVAIAVVVYGKNDEIRGARDKAEDERGKAVAAQKDAERATAATAAALAQVKEEKLKTDAQEKAAVAARGTAEKRFGLAQAALGTLVGKVQEELDDRAGTQQLRAAVLEKAMAGLDDLVGKSEGGADDPETLRIRAWAHLQRGDVNRTLDRPREALADYLAAAAAADRLAKGGHDPAPRAGLADAHDRLADAHLALGDVRRAAEAAGKAKALRPAAPKTPADIAAAAGTLDRVAAVALEEGQTHEATAAAGGALKLRREQLAKTPGDPVAVRGLAAALDREAEVKLRVGDTAGAAASAAEAVGYREKVAASAAAKDRVGPQREWAAALTRTADVAADRADLATEVAARERAADILEAWARRDPLNAAVRAEAAVARGRLGAARARAGEIPAALADTDAARARADDFARLDPASGRAARAVGLTRWDRGEVLVRAGKAADAVAEFAAAVASFEKLKAAEPDSPRAAREAVEARERLASARVAAGDPGAALAPLAAAVEARRRAADADAGSARAARDLAAAYGRLAEALLAAGNYAAAEDAAAAAAARLRARAEADPDNLAALRDLAAARTAWGRVTGARGEQTAALILLHQAHDGFHAAAKDPTSAAAADEKAAALGRLADALGDADLPDARVEYERDALAIREKLAAARPDSAYAQAGLVASHRRLAEALTAQALTADRRYGEAEKELARAKAVLDRFPGSPVLETASKEVAEAAEVLAGVRAAGNWEAVTELPPVVRARVLVLLAEEHARKKQPVLATRAAKLLGESARGPDDLYRAAVVYARAAAEKGAGPDRGDAAVELLGKAVEGGFRNPDLLRARWWEPLRARPDFQKVEARLTAPPAK